MSDKKVPEDCPFEQDTRARLRTMESRLNDVWEIIVKDGLIETVSKHTEAIEGCPFRKDPDLYKEVQESKNKSKTAIWLAGLLIAGLIAQKLIPMIL